jgi:drug/metabolite transporter (DMT)-like permease
MLALFIINVLYALGYPLSKIATTVEQPLFLLGIRMLVGGFVLLVYQLVRKRKCTLPLKSVVPLGLAGVFCMYLYNALAFWGLTRISATRAACLDNLAPLMSAFLEWIIFKDKLSPLEWIGLAVATLGTMPIIAAAPLGASLNLSQGDMSIVLSNLASVYGFILLRAIASEKEYDPLFGNSISMLVGGTCTLVHSALIETWSLATVPLCIPSTFSFALMVIIYNSIVDNLYTYLARDYTVTTLMLSGFTIPLLTALFEWLFFGMTISSAFWLSTGLIGVGLLCYLTKHGSLRQYISLYSRALLTVITAFYTNRQNRKDDQMKDDHH